MERQEDAHVLFIGSKLENAPESTFKLIEKMTKKERGLYSRYGDIDEQPPTVEIDRKKTRPYFESNFLSFKALMANEQTRVSRSSIMNEIRNLMAKNSNAYIIVYSGHGLPSGDWLVEEPSPYSDISDFSISFEDVYEEWVKRKLNQKHLLIISDSNFSGHWCRKLMLKRDWSVSVQASCRYWQKCAEDKMNGSFFLHNLHKTINDKNTEKIIEPIICSHEPTFWGSFNIVQRHYQLRLGFVNWFDMRKALGISKYGGWPYLLDEILENKIKLYEGEILDGKRNGYGVGFRENGTIEYEGNWKDDHWHGFGIVYNEQGFKVFEGNFVRGLKHGRGKEYYDTGELFCEAEYIDNIKIGKIREYYKEGPLQFEGELVKPRVEQKTDIEESFDFSDGKDNQKDAITGCGFIYKSYVCTHKTDMISSKDRQHSRSKRAPNFMRVGRVFYLNGYQLADGNWLDSLMEGAGRTYYDNGQPKLDGIFYHNYLYGQGFEYWENGQHKYIGGFKKGLYHGEGRIYSQNGSLVTEGTFNNGLLNGKAVTYYLNGEVLYEGEFEDGKALGVGVLSTKEGELHYLGRDEDILREALIGQIYNQRKKNKEYEAGEVFPIKDKQLNRSLDLDNTKNFNMQYIPTGVYKTDLANKFRVRKTDTGDMQAFALNLDRSKFLMNSTNAINRGSINKSIDNLNNSRGPIQRSSTTEHLYVSYAFSNQVDYMIRSVKSPMNNEASKKKYLDKMKEVKKLDNKISIKNGLNEIKDVIKKMDDMDRKTKPLHTTNNLIDLIELQDNSEFIGNDRRANSRVRNESLPKSGYILDMTQPLSAIQDVAINTNDADGMKLYQNAILSDSDDGDNHVFIKNSANNLIKSMNVEPDDSLMIVKKKNNLYHNVNLSPKCDESDDPIKFMFQSKQLPPDRGSNDNIVKSTKNPDSRYRGFVLQNGNQNLTTSYYDLEKTTTFERDNDKIGGYKPTIEDTVSMWHKEDLTLINKLLTTEQRIKEKVIKTQKAIRSNIRMDKVSMKGVSRTKTSFITKKPSLAGDKVVKNTPLASKTSLGGTKANSKLIIGNKTRTVDKTVPILSKSNSLAVNFNKSSATSKKSK